MFIDFEYAIKKNTFEYTWMGRFSINKNYILYIEPITDAKDIEAIKSKLKGKAPIKKDFKEVTLIRIMEFDNMLEIYILENYEKFLKKINH